MKSITVMNENMTALVVLLSKNNIPFEIYGSVRIKPAYARNPEYFTQFNIKVTSKNGAAFDIASTSSTYGGDRGLLEIMRDDGKLFNETSDEIVGYLNANDAFEIIKKELNKNTEA